MKRKLLTLGGLMAALVAISVLWGGGRLGSTDEAHAQEFLPALPLIAAETNLNMPLVLGYNIIYDDGKVTTCKEIAFADETTVEVPEEEGSLSAILNLPCIPEFVPTMAIEPYPDYPYVFSADLDHAIVIFTPAPGFVGTTCWDFKVTTEYQVGGSLACVEVEAEERYGPDLNGGFVFNASSDLTLTTSLQTVPGLTSMSTAPLASPLILPEDMIGGYFSDPEEASAVKKAKVEVCLTIVSGDGPGTGDPGQTAAFDLTVFGIRLNPSLHEGNPNASGVGVIRLQDGTFQTVCQNWLIGFHGSALAMPISVEARKSGNGGGNLGTWVASANGASRMIITDFVEGQFGGTQLVGD